MKFEREDIKKALVKTDLLDGDYRIIASGHPTMQLETIKKQDVPCIVEAIAVTGEVVARSYADAPEVDGIVYIETDKVLVPGDIIDVKIVDCDEYDLFGEY